MKKCNLGLDFIYKYCYNIIKANYSLKRYLRCESYG